MGGFSLNFRLILSSALESLSKGKFFTLFILFSIIFSDTVTDIDGNVYQTVEIGNQVWMAENLKTESYQNGTPINDNVYSYNEHEEYMPVYGKLYNKSAIENDAEVCPEGWIVPSDGDFIQLEMELGMPTLIEDENFGYRGSSENIGGKLKSATDDWDDPNSGATNESGFSALPAGYSPSADYSNTCIGCNREGYFWTNDLFIRAVDYNNEGVARYNLDLGGTSAIEPSYYYSVRCVLIEEGCMDSGACNYNEYASEDDGSCEYPEENYNCDGGFIVTDIQGNVYQTVEIGDQVWMSENLQVTKYNNGEDIPYRSINSTTPGYLDSDSEAYGKLYNWYAINDERGVCSDGWHIPSDEEFMQLEMELGMLEWETTVQGDWRG